MKDPHRSVVAAFTLALAAAVAGVASAQSPSVQRCEGKDGRVTYSNTQCPEGTVPVRKVNTDPPVSVEAKKAAQELAKKDSAAAKQVEKEQAQQEARDRKQAEERAKLDAKAKEKCERAKRDLERAEGSWMTREPTSSISTPPAHIIVPSISIGCSSIHVRTGRLDQDRHRFAPSKTASVTPTRLRPARTAACRTCPSRPPRPPRPPPP